MKLLVVSHACVTPANQAFFAEVKNVTGWDVSLLLPRQWATAYGKVESVERLHGFAGDLHTIPVWMCGNIPLHFYKSPLLGLLRTIQPDAIYVHHEPYGLATFQVFAANHLTVQCPIGFYAAQNILKNYPAPFRWFEKAVLAQARFAFPVSQGALDVLRTKGYQAQAEILPLSVDLELYRPRPGWAKNKRGELGIRPEEFLVGYVGRLAEEKGLGTLLQALARMPQQGWRCLLVGSGPFEMILRARALELGIADRVIFAGYVEHLEAANWYSCLDLLVLPSESRSHWREQFGRVLAEANACEVPVVGTDSGEIGNILRGLGGGLVVPESNPVELANAILAMMEKPERRKEFAMSGAQAVRARFDQNVVAKQFAASIQQVLWV